MFGYEFAQFFSSSRTDKKNNALNTNAVRAISCPKSLDYLPVHYPNEIKALTNFFKVRNYIQAENIAKTA